MSDKIINLIANPRARGPVAAAAIRATRLRVGAAALRPSRRSSFHARALKGGLPALKLLMDAGVVSASSEGKPLQFAEVAAAAGVSVEAPAVEAPVVDTSAADAEAAAKAVADAEAATRAAEEKAAAEASEAARVAAEEEAAAEEAASVAVSGDAEKKAAFEEGPAPAEQATSKSSKKSKKKGK